MERKDYLLIKYDAGQTNVVSKLDPMGVLGVVPTDDVTSLPFGEIAGHTGCEPNPSINIPNCLTVGGVPGDEGNQCFFIRDVWMVLLPRDDIPGVRSMHMNMKIFPASVSLSGRNLFGTH